MSCQFLLFAIYYWNPLIQSMKLNSVFNLLGLVLTLFGMLILILATYTLRKSISPFPSPRQNARLINTGVFKLIRHPIYSSFLLITLGWALYTNSLSRIIIFVSLCVLFHYKSKYEEEMLLLKFPNYLNYKKLTGKFIPKIK